METTSDANPADATKPRPRTRSPSPAPPIPASGEEEPPTAAGASAELSGVTARESLPSHGPMGGEEGSTEPVTTEEESAAERSSCWENMEREAMKARGNVHLAETTEGVQQPDLTLLG